MESQQTSLSAPASSIPPETLEEVLAAHNEWLASDGNRGKQADLSGANLSGCSIAGRNLTKANLHGAILREADVSRANFSSANLEQADLSGIRQRRKVSRTRRYGRNLIMTGANLKNAILDRADLRDVTLTGSLLWQAKLKGARLIDAELSEANLARSDLSGADLSGAVLYRANLYKANLTGCNLVRTKFTDANLVDVHGAVFDSTFLRNARLSRRPSDPWSILRRSYTGPKLLFHLLFLLTFLTPYVAKTIFLLGINQVQQGIERTTESIDKQLMESDRRLKEVTSSEVSLLNGIAEELRHITPCLHEKCRRAYVWQVLLGVDMGVSYWALALALLVYNLLRGILTSFVAPLRDEEERSGFTPIFKNPAKDPFAQTSSERWYNVYRVAHLQESYGWLMYPHRAVSLLWYIAIIAFAWHLFGWLTTPIYLPAK